MGRMSSPRSDALRAPGDAGFTLIEVIVAVFMVSLTALALAGMMNGVSRGNRYGSYQTAAAGRVQEKIEELKGMPYGWVDDGSDVLTQPAMTRTWTVVDEPVDNALKEVNVQVSWKGQGGKTEHGHHDARPDGGRNRRLRHERAPSKTVQPGRHRGRNYHGDRDPPALPEGQASRPGSQDAGECQGSPGR